MPNYGRPSIGARRPSLLIQAVFSADFFLSKPGTSLGVHSRSIATPASLGRPPRGRRSLPWPMGGLVARPERVAQPGP